MTFHSLGLISLGAINEKYQDNGQHWRAFPIENVFYCVTYFDLNFGASVKSLFDSDSEESKWSSLLFIEPGILCASVTVRNHLPTGAVVEEMLTFLLE